MEAMIFIKKCVLGFVFMLSVFPLISQNTLSIKFEGEATGLLKLKIVLEGDTSQVDQANNGLFNFPESKNKIQIDSGGYCVLILEDCRYIYHLEISNYVMFPCINEGTSELLFYKKRGRRLRKFTLRFCDPFGLTGFAEVKKKKK